MTKQLETQNKDENSNQTQTENENDTAKSIQKIETKTAQIPVPSMNSLSRLPNEAMDTFIHRVKKTTSFHLNAKKIKNTQKRIKANAKREARKEKKKLQQLEEKRALKKEHLQNIREERAWQRKIEPKQEKIHFGEYNAAPPMDLHALGNKLFGR